MNMDESLLKTVIGFDSSILSDQKVAFIKTMLTEDPLFYTAKGYKSWNSTFVSKWFESLGITEASRFQKMKIFGALLPTLKIVDCLKEIGIHPDHYISVLCAIENVDNSFMTLSEVKKWVRNEFDTSIIKEIKKYAIHGALFLSMNDEYLIRTFPTLQNNKMKRKNLLHKIELLRLKFDIIPFDFGNISELPSNNPGFKIEEVEISDDEFSSVQLNSYSSAFSIKEEFENQQMCKVCLDSPKCILSMPCNHVVMCEECANQVSKCPICREEIVSTIKIYSS
jgi:hypothetical protein